MRRLVPGCDLRDNNISQLTFIHGDTNFILAAAGDTWVTTLLVTITDSWYHSSKSKLCHIHSPALGSWICVIAIAHCHCNIFQPLEWQKRQWCDAQKQKMVYGYGYGSVWSPSLACSVQQSDIPLLKRKNLPHLLNDNCFFQSFLPVQSCAVVVLSVMCDCCVMIQPQDKAVRPQRHGQTH